MRTRCSLRVRIEAADLPEQFEGQIPDKAQGEKEAEPRTKEKRYGREQDKTGSVRRMSDVAIGTSRYHALFPLQLHHQIEEGVFPKGQVPDGECKYDTHDSEDLQSDRHS